MKAWSIIGLLFAAAILATVPVSPQVTSSGVELSLDQAQAQTYRRARVTARRVGRRSYRYARRAYRRGYAVAPSYYGASSYGYGYPSSLRLRIPLLLRLRLRIPLHRFRFRFRPVVLVRSSGERLSRMP